MLLTSYTNHSAGHRSADGSPAINAHLCGVLKMQFWHPPSVSSMSLQYILMLLAQDINFSLLSSV
jgi:hypothetical protein